MSDPFYGEIRLTGFNFAARGWAKCDGQLMPISQYDIVFSLLGTIHGGDGRTSFALPDLRGRIPVGQGTGPGLPSFQIGQKSGSETVTLLADQIPSHTHQPRALSGDGNNASPADAVWAASPLAAYSSSATPALAPMAAATLASAGGGQPHENRMPYLALNFQIALWGLYPSRS